MKALKNPVGAKPIPYGKQSLDNSDFEEVLKVLQSDWLTQGPKIGQFEEALAGYCGSKYAVAVSNGTAALHLACLVLGLRRGDEAITSPISFVATANAVVYAGAKPVFADVTYETANLDPDAVERRINSKTRAILPVHLGGLPADLERLHGVARKKKIPLIEDACHALGAEYQGSKIGSCRYSDMTIFSFHPVKLMTTGEGGCITTNSLPLYKKLTALRNHGIYKDALIGRRLGGWAYEMRELGFNYRITDLQCALGLSQLRKVEHFLTLRQGVARKYQDGFSDLEDRVMLPNRFSKAAKHAWHLYLLRIKRPLGGKLRRKLYESLWGENIRTQVHYRPIYHQPFYQKRFKNEKIVCPNAEKYYQEVISLPIYPTLTSAEIERVIQGVRHFFRENPAV